jgi:hypothetical protein
MRHLVPVIGALGVLLSADAFPGACCASTTEVTHKAWEECGAHGPRYIMNCEQGLSCYVMSQPKTPHSHICTRACSSDADCKSLGSGFTCTGRGEAYTSDRHEALVCAQAE